MKNKILPIILALVAVAAIIVCVVFNGQKSDLQKELNNATTQVEQLKADAAKAAETAKATEETAAKAAEEAAAKVEELTAAVKTAEEAAAKAEEEAAPAEPSEEVKLLTEIRDSLKAKK